MEKIILLLLAVVLFGCGPPTKYHDYRDFQYSEPQEEPLKFSNDPLLDSIMWSRYQDCLRNCSDEKKCRKECCD